MARVWRAMIVTALVALTASAAPAQQPEAKPEEKPKTLLEEIALFGYVEASYVGNLGHTSADSAGLTSSRQVNTLRLYDSDEGFSFNMAEFSVKKDRSAEHTSELQSQSNLVCRLLLEKQ